MIKTVRDSTSVPDPGLERRRRDAFHDSPERRHEAVEEIQGEPDLRLMIEPDPQTGDYVYKLIDRRTGDTVARLTREEVSKLGQGAAYTAGTVIRTRA